LVTGAKNAVSYGANMMSDNHYHLVNYYRCEINEEPCEEFPDGYEPECKDCKRHKSYHIQEAKKEKIAEKIEKEQAIIAKATKRLEKLEGKYYE
jgi:hypothetical protein